MTTVYTDEDVKQVAAALKQVVSVNPQLLFRAAQKLSSDYTIELLQENCKERPDKRRSEKLTFRASLCLWIARILVQSGSAHLDLTDFVGMTHLFKRD